ncbi:IPT/TIG domain-containing protein [Pedobacter sp. ASV1-7]|uniref:IPT/TIG domain-containing protein n=1 Tax=Pedobacter sp. ASV1-7 TaxID=3145237 RepID=UPI0032E8EC7E
MKNKILLFALIIFIAFTSCQKDNTYQATSDELLITSIFPSSGLEKDVIIITGRNFSSKNEENVVKFNGIQAIVLEASSSKLEVVVPQGATTGKISITVKGKEVEGPSFNLISAVSAYIVSTVAGNTTFGFIDGNGLDARFRNPDGVLMDLNGNVIITDRTNHSIRSMTPLGVVTTLAGNGLSGYAEGKPGQFKSPWQSTIDKDGNIIVVEKDGARIRKISVDGTVSTIAGTGVVGFQDGAGAKFNNPLDAVVDSHGNIFVVDRDNKRIRKITPTGVVSTFIGDGTTNILKNPIALAIDGNDNIFLSDANIIKRITPAGSMSDIVGSVKGYDEGIAGQPLTAKLGDIFGLNFDKVGNLILADASNHRIRMVKPGSGNDWNTATVSTIAGNGIAGKQDGLGNVAAFNNPYDVVVDTKGDIYVADNLNNSIRKITYR